MTTISNNGIGSVLLIGILLQINATFTNPAGLVYRTIVSLQNGKQAIQTEGKALNSQSELTATAPRRTGNPPIGINLSGLADWTTQWAFVDIFKISRTWVPQQKGAAWGEGPPLALTPEGWVASLKPGQYAETVMFSGGHYPTGKYTVLYDGQGKLEFGQDNVKIVSQTPDRITVDVRPGGSGIFLKIMATNPDNPIRNIRMIMPGFEDTYEQQPFHPLFLERLSKFKVLRFMDWESTNGSPIKDWSERTTPQSARQTGSKGVALEYMIQLANTLQADPWFTIPHQASDDYVRQFATLVRDRLNPKRKVYIEYSNEVWNWAFEQTPYAERKGTELGLRDPGDKDGGRAMLRFYSQRSVEMFKIWREVFGGSDRLVEVLASQGGNVWAGEQVLRWKDAYKYADEYAIASYFSGYGAASGLVEPKNADQVVRMTPEQVLDKMLEDIRADRENNFQNYQLAQRYGLGLTAYEGGVHLLSWNMPADKQAQITELFAAANRHPRMRDLYREYLTQWKETGGGLLNQFTDVGLYTKWGFWGALEYQNQDIKQAPKYQALMDFMQANPPAKKP